MAETEEDTRSKTLTPTQQTSDKLFYGHPLTHTHTHTHHPHSSSGLHFPAASIQPWATLPPLSGPRSVSRTSPGPHPACLGPSRNKFQFQVEPCSVGGMGALSALPQGSLTPGEQGQRSPTEAGVPPPTYSHPSFTAPAWAPGARGVSPTPAPLPLSSRFSKTLWSKYSPHLPLDRALLPELRLGGVCVTSAPAKQSE